MTDAQVIPIRADVPLPELTDEDGTRVPDFITRVNINEMSDEALDDMLEQIRARRMLSYIIYRQTEDDRAAVDEGKARVKLETKQGQIVKELAALDKAFERLEKRVHELRGLRIQAGLPVL